MIRRLDAPWTLALAVAAALATWLASSHGAWVADADRIRDGELWRLLSGPFVHATMGHMLRDVALCLIVGIAYEHPLRRLWPALCAATLVVPVTAAIATGWDGYMGLSGVSHGFIAAAIVFELRRRRPPWFVVVAAVGLATKIAVELALGAPLFPMDLGPGVTQAPIAHAAGAAAAVAISFATTTPTCTSESPPATPTAPHPRTPPRRPAPTRPCSPRAFRASPSPDTSSSPPAAART